jgi:hypothetical protein
MALAPAIRIPIIAILPYPKIIRIAIAAPNILVLGNPAIYSLGTEYP